MTRYHGFVSRNGRLYWDADSKEVRWGPSANSPGIVDLIELLLARGQIRSAIDTLILPEIIAPDTTPAAVRESMAQQVSRFAAQRADQPPLAPDEKRYLAGRIVDRALELGRALTQPEREHLLGLLGAPKDLKARRDAEKAAAMAEIAAEIAAHPGWSLTKIEQRYKVKRPAASDLRKAARKLRGQ